MAMPDTLRYARISLTHGSGALPAAGFGTLIPDPAATQEATRPALEVGFRHLDCAESYRNEAAVRDALQTLLKAQGHGAGPRILDDPVIAIARIARRVHQAPAQVALAWAVQRGTAFLTTSTKPDRLPESFNLSALPDDAMQEIRDGITTNIRFSAVVETDVPSFIGRGG